MPEHRNDDWAIRIGERFSWSRILIVGSWLVVAAGVLVWNEGPFWRDGVTWFRQAQAAAARGDWMGTLESVRHAREAEPENAGLATLEGHALLRLERPDPAARAFEEAHGLDPEDVEPLLGLAEARLAMDDSAAARTVLEKAAPLAMGQQARERHAHLAEAAGAPEMALESLDRPPPVGALSERIRLAVRLERWARATHLLEEALATRPGDVKLRKQLAWALQSDGRGAEAEAQYGTLADRDALDVESGVRYAWLLNEKGRYPQALRILDGLDSDAPEVAELQVRTALWAGRIDDADRRLDAALLGAPDHRRLLGLRDEVTAARQRLAAAREAGRERARAEARARLAREAPPDEPEARLAFWQARLEEDPENAAARKEVTALLETFQRFDEASGVLLAGREMGDVSDPSEILHLARLEGWAGNPRRSVRWLRHYTSLHQPVPDSVTYLLAARLLESGSAEEALYRIQPVASGADASAEQLLLAARAATAASEPGIAAGNLERLGRARALDREERIWLAGAYRSAGASDAALEAYEALRADGLEDPDVTLAIAQLRADAGDLEGATLLYDDYLADRPQDLQVRLAFSRHLAEAGRLDRSAEEYARYRDAGGPEPVALEMAKVELGRKRFGEAVRAARDAVTEAAPPAWEARLTLAEALRYEGRAGEAEALVAELAGRELAGLEGAVWRARVARLRDRPLEAQRTLERALAVESQSSPEAFLLLAQAAMDAGDWARGGRALDEARAAGAEPRRLRPLQERHGEATRPSLRLVVSGGSDDVDLTQVQGGVAAEGWIGESRARIVASAAPVVLSQGSVREEVVSVAVGADSLVLGSTVVGVGAGTQISTDDEVTVSGRADATRRFEEGSSLGAHLSRAPVWEGHSGLEPLRYSRIRDLGALGLGLMETDLRVRGQLALGIGRSGLAESGVTWYSDGNRRSYVYGHAQLPVSTAVGRWMSVQPNAYLEWFEDQVPSYVTPARYLSAGLRGQGIWDWDRTSLHLELNPHFFDYPGESGLGLDAEARVTSDFGPVQLWLRGLYFRQEDLYDLYRASLGVRVPWGGR